VTHDVLPADLAAALDAAAPALGEFARLRHVAEIDSTNDVALSLAGAGAPQGTSILADRQRSGRGRRGRAWFSPAGAGLYLSVIVRPHVPAHALPLVTLGAGVAAADAVRATTGLPIELKWPNDLVIGRPWRKLAGVLCETAGAGSRVDAVVIGIGINLLTAAYPPDIAGRATSIEAEMGRPIERAPLVVHLLVGLRRIVQTLYDGRAEAVCAEWRTFARAGLQGAPVRWYDQDRERRGRASDIDVDGALLIDTGGRVERIVAGEVMWD
jgi:BirA family biotin operon repressor/biotin-[acetyl-CoA-carboxylase] ligase